MSTAGADHGGPDLSHLHPSVRESALLGLDERLPHLRADRWIGYTRATTALQRLETLLDWPRKQRMPNLLIIGPTNNGKSMLIEKFRRDHPEKAKDGYITRPVVVMQTPSTPSVTRFYTNLVAALGMDARPRSQAAELEQLAQVLFKESSTRMLVIDELHNMLAAPGNVRQDFLNLLRYLGNQMRIPLVGIGTREAYLAVRSDDQLENRFQPMVLPRWEPDDPETLTLLASFAASLPLQRPSTIATPAMARYLLDRSEGTIGELASLLTTAAITAVSSGEESITADSLAQADYLGPTERRRTFERALH